MPDERGIVSKSKLTALANKIKAAAGESGSFTLDELAALDISGGGETITLSAVFDAGENKIFTTDTLDDLKQYLTVTATVSGQTSATYTIPADAFTLSGSLSAGSNTITVTWLNRTTTFTVSGVIAATDVTPTLTGLSNAANTRSYYNSNDKSLSVWNTTSQTYKMVMMDFTLDEGFRYRITADLDSHVNTSSAVIYFSNPTESKSIMGTSATGVSGKLLKDANPSESEYFTTDARLCFTCTWATAAFGNVTYRNFKVIKYLEVS